MGRGGQFAVMGVLCFPQLVSRVGALMVGVLSGWERAYCIQYM